MSGYSIDFKLLLPRYLLFRGDVLPFIIIYGALATSCTNTMMMRSSICISGWGLLEQLFCILIYN